MLLCRMTRPGEAAAEARSLGFLDASHIYEGLVIPSVLHECIRKTPARARAGTTEGMLRLERVVQDDPRAGGDDDRAGPDDQAV